MLFSIFGECTFDNVPEATGPYTVSFTEFHTREFSNEVSVFYPSLRKADAKSDSQVNKHAQDILKEALSQICFTQI